MANAILITLEKDIAAMADYLKGATGKALARETDRIDSAARRKGVTAITSLLSESQAALRAQLEENGIDPAKMRLPPEKWFPAAEGLKTVRALAEYINANLNDFKQPRPILRDLKAVQVLLDAAEPAGVGFHFTKGEL